MPDPASQCATATVSGRPSPSRSPVACRATVVPTAPHSSGNRAAAGSGAGTAAPPRVVVRCSGAVAVAVAVRGWSSPASATTPAIAAAVASQCNGLAAVWARSGSAGVCTRYVS